MKELSEVLEAEIDRKCMQIQEARREKAGKRAFVFLCAVVVVLPLLFVLWGIKLAMLAVPAVAMGAVLLLLAPIVLNQQGGMEL